jgi:hypothetical protein
VRVDIHRQLNIRMPCQRLGGFGRHVGQTKIGNERVPQRMEVGKFTGGIFVLGLYGNYTLSSLLSMAQTRFILRRCLFRLLR